MSENVHPEPPPSPAEGWLPDRLLGAAELDPGDLALAAMLHAATASGTSEELASEPAVLAAYQAILAPAAAAPVAAAARSVTVTPSLAHTTRARTRGVHRLAARSIAAIVAIVATLSLGGVATAAYTGALPAPLQDFAHRHIGAPAVGHGIWAHHTNPNAGPKAHAFAHGHPGGSHRRPDAAATSQAAMLAGLCKAAAKGHLGPTSPGYQSLVAAAGGTGKVTAYCADLPGPGKRPPRPSPSARPHASATGAGSASARAKTRAPG